MLQALKLDGQTPPAPRNRESEGGSTGLDAGFAAFLAQAAWLPASSLPAPQPSAEPAKSTSPHRVEPPAARENSTPGSPTPSTAPNEAAGPSREPLAPRYEPERGSPAATQEPAQADAPSAPESPSPGAPGTGGKEAGAAVPMNPGSAEQGASLPAGLVSPPVVGRTAGAQGFRPEPQATPATGEPAERPLTLSAAQASDRPELRLRIEPSAAQTWSATGTALRPLQEFLAQPRPPLETPAPLREQGASAPPPPENPSQPLPRAEAVQPQTETAHPASALQVAAAARPPQTAREAPIRGVQPALATAGVVAVRAAAAPEAPAATQPRASLPALQVEGSIRWMLQNRQRGAELHLHPESLGRVTIRLTVEGTEVHARIWASEASTLPLLQEHRAHLEQALKDQGLNLGSFDLNQGGRGDASREPGRPLPGPGIHAPLDPGPSQQELPTPASILPGGAHLIEVFA